MKLPTISVIMPVYNAQQYLEETIKSLQAQTFSDYEVIFVDDMSTDESLSIMNRTTESDDRFRVLQQKKAGAGAARNVGFTHAQGEYTIFLDSDDLFSPQLLEKLHHAIITAQADIAACNFSRFDASGKETQHEGVHTRWIPEGLTVFSYRDTPDYIMRVINPTPWNKLYRSAFIRQSGLKFEEISSTNDITFASVSVAAAERVTYIPDSLVRYRIGHAGTISAGKVGKLNNVKTAVFSAVRQARALPHSDVIQNAILSFVVDNFIVALSRFIKDFSDSDAKEFYQMVHETFNREEFANVDPRTLHNPKQYLEFCSVRKHDYETMKRMISRRLIVSLTTYPRRIGLIPQVLQSIYAQTRQPDEIVLWLAESQFPHREEDLPGDVRKLAEENRLTIRWCEDLKAHKKYFFAMQEFPDDLIVTIDDDLTYSKDMLSSLYASYLLYPEAVSTVRAHLVMLDEDKKIMPYQAWIQETDTCIHEPCMQLMATGGAGVLYPPHLFRKEFFDREAVMENSPYADDLWLKAMQLASDVPVVVARPHEQLQYLPDSQEEALHLINVRKNQNDVQLAQIIRWMDENLEPGLFMRRLTESGQGTRILGIAQVSRHLDTERKVLRRKFTQADGKAKQLDKRIWLADKRKMEEVEKRKIAEDRLQQTRNDLKKLQDDLHRTMELLNDSRNQLRLVQNEKQRLQVQLVQTQQRLERTQTQLQQNREKLQQTQNQLKQTQSQLKQTQDQLKQTRQKLHETEESKPIGRQLRAVGQILAEQKAAGRNPLGLGFKYMIYGLAWIPEKLLAGMMFYLKNGGKQTLKKLFGRSSEK